MRHTTDAHRIEIIKYNNGEDFAKDGYSTASFTAKVTDIKGVALHGEQVLWNVRDVQNNSPATMPGWEKKKTGLAWGALPQYGSQPTDTVRNKLRHQNIGWKITTTALNGETTAHLTDIVGERIMTVQVKVRHSSGKIIATQKISFGVGPLSLFLSPIKATWPEAYQECNGVSYFGGYTREDGWKGDAYVGGGRMPTWQQMRLVSLAEANQYHPQAGYGAACAAGWPDGVYWTGHPAGTNRASVIILGNFGRLRGAIGDECWVACLRNALPVDTK